MRLDDVEIKISFSQHETSTAVSALQLPPRTNPWKIYFCEDVNVGSLQTPLLDLHVVLRARVRPDDDDDFTVKLRPCRCSQLPDRWFEDTTRLKVEADWAGNRHLLAASYTRDRPDDVIPAVVDGQRPFTDLFTEGQRDFLAGCAGAFLNLDALSVLPPVAATRWKELAAAPPELGLRAERWTVGDLDFLELSTTARVEEALAKQAAAVRFVESLGLVAPADQETKTRRVLDHLVRARVQAASGSS